MPAKSQPDMVRNARSRIVLQNTGEWLKGLLPEDPENTILKRLKRPKPEDSEPQDGPPDQRGSLDSPAREAAGYGQSDRTGMQKLIQGKSAAR